MARRVAAPSAGGRREFDIYFALRLIRGVTAPHPRPFSRGEKGVYLLLAADNDEAVGALIGGEARLIERRLSGVVRIVGGEVPGDGRLRVSDG